MNRKGHVEPQFTGPRNCIPSEIPEVFFGRVNGGKSDQALLFSLYMKDISDEIDLEMHILLNLD